MKKILMYVFLIMCLVLLVIFENPNKEKAASGSQNSDIQLLARAINGEARGENYEGQV